MFADYDQIMERLALQQLWDFPGGVHPAEKKSLSNQSNIARLPLPDVVHIPLKQHIGVQGDVLVKVGDTVKKGQALTASENAFAVPVHASSSGEVIAIDEHVSAHPSGMSELTVTIKLDGLDTQAEFTPLTDYNKRSKSEIIEAICRAGISGMGGAGFPTHLKSNNVQPIEFLIINGIECEPYISSDDRLMREHAWQIRQGIDILCYLLNPKQVIVAVEDNKPEALETLSIACQQQDTYHVVSVPTKYPAGGEKQLIQVLTSREVPATGLPVDVGCLMYNVGTCYAIADAVMEGKPLIERVVTLTGEALSAPKNVWARLGTPIKHLLKHAGYESEKQSYPRIIMGGPMMGFTLSSVQVPVVKTTNCILVPAKGELPLVEDERACIRCSACADACPASLLPQQMFWHSKAKEYDKAQEYNLFDCIECGACAYVCPSEIPLVHYYRKAKADIRQQRVEKERAEKARIRFEARQERLLKEKQAREEKHRLAAQARQKAMKTDGGAAKDKIAAALARAKAKKAALAKQSDSAQTLNDSKANDE
ncbi:electron transport complex subunit RsxC [Glaciecola siphonariae]|uniref:Ion-translocating oxidoreductase complex subunit C n=1 Tax=Glaciecola siphonariae TaxID=521012 RepID=A0ABV9LTG9_9ALTE